MLAQGQLDGEIGARIAIAAEMKSLQAALRHLSWQTTRIAAGDFSQRVDFMGGGGGGGGGGIFRRIQ